MDEPEVPLDDHERQVLAALANLESRRGPCEATRQTTTSGGSPRRPARGDEANHHIRWFAAGESGA